MGSGFDLPPSLPLDFLGKPRQLSVSHYLNVRWHTMSQNFATLLRRRERGRHDAVAPFRRNRSLVTRLRFTASSAVSTPLARAL
jgi:hypothetical protein